MKKVFTTRLDEKEIEKLKIIANQQHRTPSNLFQHIVKKYLEDF